jgi:hypothetical protein
MRELSSTLNLLARGREFSSETRMSGDRLIHIQMRRTLIPETISDRKMFIHFDLFCDSENPFSTASCGELRSPKYGLKEFGLGRGRFCTNVVLGRTMASNENPNTAMGKASLASIGMTQGFVWKSGRPAGLDARREWRMITLKWIIEGAMSNGAEEGEQWRREEGTGKGDCWSNLEEYGWVMNGCYERRDR